MTTITKLRELLDSLPREHDGDYCPVCHMPLIRGDCVRHDTDEMIAWGNKYRRDNEALEAYNAKLLEVAEAATRYRQTIRDGELATGRRQRHDADTLDDALARLEAAK